MILLTATTFFSTETPRTKFQWAEKYSHLFIFAIALLLPGLSSTITSDIVVGTISPEYSKSTHDIKDNNTCPGITLSLIPALTIIPSTSNLLKGLNNKTLLSLQLPVTTIFTQIYSTSSKTVREESKKPPLFYLVTSPITTLLNIPLMVSST